MSHRACLYRAKVERGTVIVQLFKDCDTQTFRLFSEPSVDYTVEELRDLAAAINTALASHTDWPDYTDA